MLIILMSEVPKVEVNSRVMDVKALTKKMMSNQKLYTLMDLSQYTVSGLDKSIQVRWVSFPKLNE